MCHIPFSKISSYQLILDSSAGHLPFIAACPPAWQFDSSNNPPKKSCPIYLLTCKFSFTLLNTEVTSALAIMWVQDLQLFTGFVKAVACWFFPLTGFRLEVRTRIYRADEEYEGERRTACLFLLFLTPSMIACKRIGCILVWFSPFGFLLLLKNRKAGREVGFHCVPVLLFSGTVVFHGVSLRQDHILVTMSSE